MNYNNFSDDMDSESDDDWFYDSIKRYKLLQMFEFETAKSHLFSSDDESICVIGNSKSGQDEIMELVLPKKLTTPPGQGKLEKSSDLTVSCGGYTENCLVDIKVVYGRKQVITSEKDVYGVKVYQLGSEDSDQIYRCGNFQFNILEPHLALNKNGVLAMATNNKTDVHLIDITTGKQTTSIKSHKSDDASSSTIKEEFVSRDTIAICEIESGITNVYDLRSNTNCCHLLSDQIQRKDEWTLSSNYSCNPTVPDESSSCLGLISKQGHLKILDFRKTTNCIYETNVFDSLGVENKRIKSTNIFLRFSPHKQTVVSISGFDENVYVCEILSEKHSKVIFKHDGHRSHMVGRNLFTTDHLWYGKSIISASENKTVQCWQFSENP